MYDRETLSIRGSGKDRYSQSLAHHWTQNIQDQYEAQKIKDLQGRIAVILAKEDVFLTRDQLNRIKQILQEPKEVSEGESK
jgi:hypothetical protein